ncbi:M48 family metalloprotease [Chitinophaga lutea]
MPTVSPAFRKLAMKACFTILLFVVTYLLLFAASIGLTVLCGWAALGIVSFSASGLTLIFGLGLVLMGGMITYFLLKFIFSRHKVDRSGLTEVTREQEPRLFALVQEIVDEVKTDFPKRIYISAEVNAYVFYDSSFWSMFFPIRKNLTIGMGLVNSSTRLELKAVLAHEFGHFSQRSMKLGSFVYNVNKVIYNMLYDNESYNEGVGSIASLHGFFTLFATIAATMLQGVQWLLRKIYNLINVTYMGLSREMEFHADEVAANVAGSAPLISSLLRMNIADDALNRVTDAYNRRYQQSLISGNIYTQQRWMMAYVSSASSLEIKGGLPQVTEAHFERYNKSKLVIKDQWASHPSTEDRIAALNRLNIRKEEEDFEPANHIFQDIRSRQESFTKDIFSAVTYPGEVATEADADFEKHYTEEHPVYRYPEMFNGYYDRWNPAPGLPESSTSLSGSETAATFFNDEMSALAASFQILENDKALLHQLTVVEHSIKTFDYDGEKYNMDNIYSLMERLDGIIAANRRRLQENDAAAFAWFRSLAADRGMLASWEDTFRAYGATQQLQEERLPVFNKLIEAISFMQEQHAYAQIDIRMRDVHAPEQAFRQVLSAMLSEDVWQKAIRPSQREVFTKYLSKDWVYFTETKYDDDAVDTLYGTLRAFPVAIYAGCEAAKVTWLESCAELAGEPVMAG